MRTGLVLLACQIGATAVVAQSLAAPAVVTITVRGDEHYTLPHTIRIAPETIPYARSAADIERRIWRAERTSERGVDSVTSEECPAVRTVALSFGRLPAIEPTSPAHRVYPDPTPVPPTRKDGYSTTLRFTVVTADGSEAQITVEHGNAYAGWGHDAVSALLRCWGPLTPDRIQPSPNG